MRNKWIKLGVVTLVMCAAVIMATALAVRMSRTVPLDECSELYRRYCDVPGIRAAFIKDKKINDTVFVDVTLLQAMDDSAWCVLQKDFNLPAIPEELEALFYGDSSRVIVKCIAKGHPEMVIDTSFTKVDMVAYSYFKRTITVFDVTEDNQRKAILRNQLITKD